MAGGSRQKQLESGRRIMPVFRIRQVSVPGMIAFFEPKVRHVWYHERKSFDIQPRLV